MHADKVLPEVEIELGGAVRKLKFGFKALLRLEQLCGVNLLTGELDFHKLENMRNLLWAAMLEGDPSFDGKLIDGKPSEDLEAKLETIASWIEIPRFAEIMTALQQAFVKALAVGKSNVEESEEDEDSKKG